MIFRNICPEHRLYVAPREVQTHSVRRKWFASMLYLYERLRETSKSGTGGCKSHSYLSASGSLAVGKSAFHPLPGVTWAADAKSFFMQESLSPQGLQRDAAHKFLKFLANGSKNAILPVACTPTGCASALCLISDAAVKGSVE